MQMRCCAQQVKHAPPEVNAQDANYLYGRLAHHSMLFPSWVAAIH